jgi:hypothetical protein
LSTIVALPVPSARVAFVGPLILGKNVSFLKTRA